jgi:hypothetical protein
MNAPITRKQFKTSKSKSILITIVSTINTPKIKPKIVQGINIIALKPGLPALL